MRIEYVGKNINLRDNFKTEVEKKLSRLEKYFDEDVEARVVFSSHSNSKKVEITIWLKRGTILRSEVTTNDMLASVDGVIDALDKQIGRYKKKLRKRSNESIRFEEVPIEDTTLEEESDTVVKVKKIGIKPMFIEDAIMQMNLLHHDFFVYEDAESGKISVVYRRKDGNFGLIEQV